MDKTFWLEIIQNDYAIPEDHSLKELTSKLFSYLKSTDPELRDDIGYIIYANWLEMGKYSQSEINEHIQILLGNLETGIGEYDTDSVFLRSFSILFLAEIIHNDNKAPILEKEPVQEILGKGLWYLVVEKDSRGYVKSKGWAHALAHTADLMRVLAKNEHTGLTEHKQILGEIADRLIASSDRVYIHGEDDRLSAAVISILKRDMLPVKAVDEWLEAFLARNWKGAWTDEERSCAFFNVRNFLRSLYIQATTDKDLPRKDELAKMVMQIIHELRPF